MYAILCVRVFLFLGSYSFIWWIERFGFFFKYWNFDVRVDWVWFLRLINIEEVKNVSVILYRYYLIDLNFWSICVFLVYVLFDKTLPETGVLSEIKFEQKI